MLKMKCFFYRMDMPPAKIKQFAQDDPCLEKVKGILVKNLRDDISGII
mgnify:CR=1 FL=1